MIQSVIQKLVNDAAVKAAVGLNKAGSRYKVFPIVADQDEELPYTVAAITGNEPYKCKDGAGVLDRVDFQLITFSKEYAQMDGIDNAIRFCLDRQKWTLENIPVDAWFTNHKDQWDQGKQCYARVSDYSANVTRTPA
jgi:hypothetical protein